MIAHVILWQPRPGLSTEQRQGVLAALTAAVNGVKTVKACRIGRRVKHGLPGYERLMPVDFEFAAIMEFDSVDGLREYLRHPAHESIGERFTSDAAAALAYDYEVLDLNESSRFL